MSRTERTTSGFGTRAVHAGQQPDPSTGAIMTPVYLTSTYVQEAPGEHLGYEYARVSNPTRTALEENLAALEGGKHGICFSSGMAAMDALLRKLSPGDHVIAGNDLYGGSFRLMKQIVERFGIEFTFVDMTDVSNVGNSMRDTTKLIWAETPTNPLLRLTDIAAVAKASGDAMLVVDNTFASPYLQQPLALGADMVVHSTTKYVGGHSDVVGGAVVTDNDEWAEHLRFQVKAVGAVPSPMDCFLLLRSTKSLHVRMERHCENARAVADFLDTHPRVGTVYYPGLPAHDGHELAKRQMRDFGGMVSFILKNDDLETAFQFMQSTRLFSLAESLGGVESLVCHPPTMTHGSVPADVRHAAGLSDSLIRLSVGIEDKKDLIEDLEQALEGL